MSTRHSRNRRQVLPGAVIRFRRETAKTNADEAERSRPKRAEFNRSPPRIRRHEQGEAKKAYAKGVTPTPVTAAHNEERHSRDRGQERIEVQLLPNFQSNLEAKRHADD